jgi:membrane protein required for colicin V production
MTPIDIFFIILIAVAAIRGYFRGFITEVFSVAGPVIAILGGILLSKPLSRLIAPLGGEAGSLGNQIISFLIIFIVIYLVLFLLRRMMHGLVERVHLVGADRALGVLLGLVEGLTVSFIIAIILLALPLEATRRLMSGSLVGSLVAPFLPEFIKPKSAALRVFYV